MSHIGHIAEAPFRCCGSGELEVDAVRPDGAVRVSQNERNRPSPTVQHTINDMEKA